MYGITYLVNGVLGFAGTLALMLLINERRIVRDFAYYCWDTCTDATD